jgi:hypothetical protein
MVILTNRFEPHQDMNDSYLLPNKGLVSSLGPKVAGSSPRSSE